MIVISNISENDVASIFKLFDPKKDNEKDLPTESGNYIIVAGSLEGVNSKLKIPIEFCTNSIKIEGREYYVVYTGQTQGVGLRNRYRHHFTEK